MSDVLGRDSSVGTSKNMFGHLYLMSPWRLAELRRVPVVGPLLQRLSRALLPLQARVWVQVRKGPTKDLWLNVNARTGRRFYEGSHEPMVQEALSNHLGLGKVFYDLGANIGFFTLLGARCVGRAGRVYAFEPDPEVCDRLRANVARNGFSNVEVVQGAVCSATGSTQFVRANSDVSSDMVVGKLAASVSGAPAICVRSIALDDFLKEARPPDVVKCDVEGAELEVLNGGRLLLEQCRPIIVCEAHSAVGAERVSQLLAQNGYGLRWIDDNHLLAVP